MSERVIHRLIALRDEVVDDDAADFDWFAS
jgi:hypothetical protein